MLAFGLYSHIRANHIRTTLLMLCFIATVVMIYFSICLVREVFDLPSSVGELFTDALDRFVNESPWLAIGLGLWFIIMVLYHHKILDAATGAKNITRADEPKLYAILEALCISRGMNVPQLKIIESDSLNACAAGLVEDDHSISVTRGLLSTLTSEELEAVLAHELTHIRNRDAQMMVVATIFVGFIGIIGSIIMHHWDIMLREALRKAGRDSEERPGILPIVIGIFTAVLIAAMSFGLSLLIRLAISRKREYLADAGAVELTKNPDALIRALRKIEGHAQMAAVAPKARAFFIETPAPGGTRGWFATHPSIDERVAALVNFAGGHDVPRVPATTQAQRMVWRIQSKV
jgi:heat shock protein HtpX